MNFCREENELIDYLKDKVKVLEAKIERDPEDDWSIGMKTNIDTYTLGKAIVKVESMMEAESFINKFSDKIVAPNVL